MVPPDNDSGLLLVTDNIEDLAFAPPLDSFRLPCYPDTPSILAADLHNERMRRARSGNTVRHAARNHPPWFESLVFRPDLECSTSTVGNELPLPAV